MEDKDQTATQHDQPQEEVPVEEPYQLTVKLPASGKQGQISLLVSPRETIHDIKQSIMESPETCIHSCFYLQHKGARISDFLELGEVEGITTECQFELIEDVYTEKDVRLHINRLRDLLGGPYKPSTNAIAIDASLSFLTAVTGDIDEEIVSEGEKKMEDLFSSEPIPEHAFTGKDVVAKSNLADFVPKTFVRAAPVCLKSLTLSGWNPVQHARRLAGDLLYLNVVTLENENLCITATTRGFYVNQSTMTEFNPKGRGAGKHAHSLIRLLQQVSPLFAKNFALVQDFITQHHMLEVLPVNTYHAEHAWAVVPPTVTYDAARPAEPYLHFGADAVDALRDWNDELQSHRELPRTNLQERVLRERLITKVQSEFTEAAVQGAMSVVQGSVTPLNPLEPEDAHMFVYNNIFFSKANDGRGTMEAVGGDAAAHVATNKDLEGVKVVNSIDPEGLATLGSVIVDYKGERIVAQSIVPGIFRRQDESSIVYGSVDNGLTIAADNQFHEAIGAQIAKALHLKQHAVNDAQGNAIDLHTSVETKGLLGADGRRYLLDLYRLNPVDIQFQEEEGIEKDGKPAYPHKMTLLRPELISLYWEHKFRQWVKQKTDEIKAERAKNKPEIKKDGENDAQETEKAEKAENDETSQEQQEQQEDEEEIKIDVSAFDLSFNPDVFTSQLSSSSSPDDEQAVRDAAQFLNEEILPSLVLDFASYAISPLDGDALTKAMHRRGINMRYLGKLANLVALSNDKRIHHIYDLAIQEMIVRASKRLLRKYLAECALEETRACIAHYFNCLVGHEFNPKPMPVVPAHKQRNDFEWTHLTPASLKNKLTEQVRLWFRFDLPEGKFDEIKPLPVLREICLRVGIQLHAIDYRFHALSEEEIKTNAEEDARLESLRARSQKPTARKNKKQQQALDALNAVPPRRKTTFIPDDILNVLPTVKQASTRSVFAEETFEAGKVSLAQGHRQLGLELLLESLTLHEQTYGFLHPETSKCYATLAMIYHHSEDREAALDLQRKAVIASERTLGVDHPETVHHYLNLGLFEHAAGRTKLALRYIRHALYYWDLLFGPGHPDSATADNNAGVMLQSLRDYPTSTKFFERACNTQEAILGKDHVITATGYHVLAKAYTLEGDFNKALAAERVAYGVFEKKLGDEDPRTKESDMWLKELTANALATATAQRAKLMQQQQQQANLVPTNTHAVPHGRAQQTQDIPTGEMPIDQVMQYINGDANKTSSTKKAGKRAGNKRR
ncbi:clustered mitochondria-domain-containing protein [Gongronella butleri]|nr:clustered mitochondria-domain-containing protein [Gongronella butleri]